MQNNTFTKEELEILEIARKDRVNYKIEVDNDLIEVSKYNKHSDEFEPVFKFEDFGETFLIKFLKYVGYNAEPV